MNAVIDLIKNLLPPAKVFLIGKQVKTCNLESVFSKPSPASEEIARLYLLVLLNDFQDKKSFEWQDLIENNCFKLIPVTCIVLVTDTFIHWLQEGHDFACRIFYHAALLIDTEPLCLPVPSPIDPTSNAIAREKIFQESMNRSKEFYAGYDFYISRKQNKMAAFMLHQSTEQALLALVRLGTGFRCQTHNLDKLLRYGSMVYYQLETIFPRTNAKDKYIFRLFLNAYSECRYKEGFTIKAADLAILSKVVKKLWVLLKEEFQESEPG